MEYFDVCDEQGNPTGRIVSREVAHNEGIPHHTAHVWIIRRHEGKVQILAQKRSQEKDSFPGLYDTSSAGHIPAGSDTVSSALRELHEELGIVAKPEQLTYAGMFRIRYEKEFHGKLFRDNEVASVYVYSDPVDIDALTLQESEVEDVCWFDLDAVCEEIRHTRERFCIPSNSITVLKQFLASNPQEPV